MFYMVYSRRDTMGFDARDLTTLTREDLAQTLFKNKEKTGASTALEANKIAKTVILTYQSALLEGNSLALSRIGHLVILDKKARPGRNPLTGENFEVSARRTVSMRKTPQSDRPYLKRQDMLLKLKEALSGFEDVNVVGVYDVYHDFIKRVTDKLHRVEFRGLGVFYPAVREAGEVRNPKTGEKKFSKERVKIAFRPSKKLLSMLN
jgi:integration host factor subunit alpha